MSDKYCEENKENCQKREKKLQKVGNRSLAKMNIEYQFGWEKYEEGERETKTRIWQLLGKKIILLSQFESFR